MAVRSLLEVWCRPITKLHRFKTFISDNNVIACILAMIFRDESNTEYNRDAVECESCGKVMWADSRDEMEIHEDECSGYSDPKDRFDVGDRVTFSDFGMVRLSPLDRQFGEIVGFAEDEDYSDHLVEVQWDDGHVSGTYAHTFISHAVDDYAFEAEMRETFDHIVALIQLRDKHLQDTGERLFDAAPLIKSAGVLRDEMDDTPISRDIDPSEVFDSW